MIIQWPRRDEISADESGFMSAEWLAAFGVLVIPVFILVVSLIQVPPRVSAGNNAASQAALAYVGALDQSQAIDQAEEAAEDAITSRNLGISASEIRVEVVESNGYCPGREVTIEVTIPIPVSINPFGDSALFEFGSLSSRSTERIDDYAELANVGDMASGLCDTP